MEEASSKQSLHSIKSQNIPKEMDSKISSQIKEKSIWRPHLAVFIANIPSLVVGLSVGWSAPALPLLLAESPEAVVPSTGLSLAQGAWLGALLPLASLAGALGAGPLAERAGRKGALLTAVAPALLGWLLMALAPQSFWLLASGRVLTGVMTGVVSAPAALYCEEIAEAHRRGKLGSYQFLANCVGMCAMYALGAWLPYAWFTAIPLLPCLLFASVLCWMPESPAFLASRGRRHEADAALRWLRGPSVDTDAELSKLMGSAAAASTVPVTSILDSLKSLPWTRPWKSTSIRGFFIASTMMWFQQGSGNGFILFYTVQLFDELGSSLSGSVCSIIFGVTYVLSTSVSMLFVDRVGRRILLTISSIGMGTCLFTMSIYSYARNEEWVIGTWKWLPLFAILLHGICFATGIGPISWILLAELLPMESKGWAGPCVVCTNRLAMFVVAIGAPLSIAYYGQMATFLFFGCFCFVGAIFIAFCVPETKGKIKSEILKALGGDLP